MSTAITPMTNSSIMPTSPITCPPPSGTPEGADRDDRRPQGTT
jgi:hypothetical protein